MYGAAVLAATGYTCNRLHLQQAAAAKDAGLMSMRLILGLLQGTEAHL